MLGENAAFQQLVEGIRSGRAVHHLEAPEVARPYLIAALWEQLTIPMVVIVPRPDDARRMHDQLLTYLGEESPVYLFSEPEVLPYERLVADAATNNQRMLVLDALIGDQNASVEGQKPVGHSPFALVVSSTAAALRRTLSPKVLKESRHVLRVGEKASLSELFSSWVDLGYKREEGVEIPGTFSRRGGIVDIYPPSSPRPVRLEFLGDEIDSIRLFDPVTQRSVRMVEQVTIIPAEEVLASFADRDMVSKLIGNIDLSLCLPAARQRFQDELSTLSTGDEIEEVTLYNGLLNRACLIDHLPDSGLLVLNRQGEIESEAWKLDERDKDLRAARLGRGELPDNFPSPQHSCAEFLESLESRPRLMVQGRTGSEGGFDFRPAPSYFGRTHQFAGDVKQAMGEGKRVVALSRHAARLGELLEEGSVAATVLSDLSSPPAPGSLSVLAGTLREGWILPLNTGWLTLVTDAEIFGTSKERRRRPHTPVRRETFLSELVPGSHVVHVDHGVARFSGTVQKETEGEKREYLVLEYAEGDKLYVPTDHLDRVSPYMASSDRPPSLTRLSTAEWSRIKDRAKDSAKEMAQELVQLYASRQVVTGNAISPDSPWQREMEDSFPYEETSDQERTIQEVKRDMERPLPMDRLVCGDVGYGKTEVALRACFKTVSDNMQAGLLVPTTVLAQQHYSTFIERLSPFPVRVEVLSRFRTRKEQAEVIEGLKQGTVDIVIGTHRLLQKDVKFKNLGLVVVDEEQRFGVAHKERLKRMRREVDMLTLSATPIPRTLYMGLSGIRDMSTMETPPEERIPIKTYVCEYSDDVIKEAIIRELERGGQVYFLHNRVRTIRQVADDLRRLVPQARIMVGHGRMAEDELEEVMTVFARGEVDVLVCTTIIESGLDIPNVNTLIIDRADRFGLSQLYQLRGRVGRGGHRAYSYLLIPRNREITEAAGKRLNVILEANELGAGFRIAMRDLEIRGAGNVLGSEQSGHIHAVGFELYSQLLQEAVAEIKAGGADPLISGDTQPAISAVRVSLPLSAHLPDSYVSHLPTRLAIYQRLTKVKSVDEAEDTREELRDRFGPFPKVVENLFFLVDLKLLAGEAGVESIALSGSTITLALHELVGSARAALERALGPFATVGNQRIRIELRRGAKDWKECLMRVLEQIVDFREQVQLAAAGG